MPEYRFFYLKKDGHVAGTPATYEFPTDGAAIEQARLLLNGRDIEIWEGRAWSAISLLININNWTLKFVARSQVCRSHATLKSDIACSRLAA